LTPGGEYNGESWLPGIEYTGESWLPCDKYTGSWLLGGTSIGTGLQKNFMVANRPGVKGVKAKGWGSCYQTGDQGGWEVVTTSRKLAIQVVKQGFFIDARDCNKGLLVHRVNIKMHVM
jgi:hypothetical protein